MRCNNNELRVSKEYFEKRNGKRGAFGGVGCRPELIEQHQAFASCRLKDFGDMTHVGCERAEPLCNVLPVAYVGEHAVEDRDARV